MSRRNGDKARTAIHRKRRTTQRIKDRAARAAALLQPRPVPKQAKPKRAPKPVEPPPVAAPPAEPAKKPARARKAAAPPAE